VASRIKHYSITFAMKTSTLVALVLVSFTANALTIDPVAITVAWEQAPQGERIVPRLDQSE
jgi:hypothetical protein